MTSVVAIQMTDGRWVSPDQQAAFDRHLVDASKSDVEIIADRLGQICRLAQRLNELDARRVRELVNACASFLSATTRLPGPDQALFEKSIRGR